MPTATPEVRLICLAVADCFPNGKQRFGMRLPLMRNQLPTTSTPHHLLIPPHAFAAYAEPTPNNQYTAFHFLVSFEPSFDQKMANGSFEPQT